MKENALLLGLKSDFKYLSPSGRDAGEPTAAPLTKTPTSMGLCVMLTKFVALPADGAVGCLHPNDANLKDKIQMRLGWLGNYNTFERILSAALIAD